MPLQCVTSCDWVQIACHYIVLLSVIGYIWCAIHYSKFLAVIGSDERMKTGEKKLSLGLLKRLRNKYYFYNIFSFLHPANVFVDVYSYYGSRQNSISHIIPRGWTCLIQFCFSGAGRGNNFILWVGGYLLY